MAESNRIEQYLDFMIYILRADGVVDAEEKRHMLSIMVDGMKLDPTLVERYRETLESQEWSEVSDEQLKAVSQGLDASSIGHLVRDAYAMAAADGEIHQAEVGVVNRFLVLAGIPEERLEQVDLWARQSLALAHQGTLLLTPPS